MGIFRRGLCPDADGNCFGGMLRPGPVLNLGTNQADRQSEGLSFFGRCSWRSPVVQPRGEFYMERVRNLPRIKLGNNILVYNIYVYVVFVES